MEGSLFFTKEVEIIGAAPSRKAAHGFAVPGNLRIHRFASNVITIYRAASGRQDAVPGIFGAIPIPPSAGL